MGHKHEVIVKPFSDVHHKAGRVVATLLHDPTVEGLDVALYMDGSASMEPTYGPRGVLAKLAPVKNQVEPQMHWMLEYLAGKDKDGKVRVAYWATGSGSDLEPLGTLLVKLMRQLDIGRRGKRRERSRARKSQRQRGRESFQ